MNHPIITRQTLDLVINQLEKYNKELDNQKQITVIFYLDNETEDAELTLHVDSLEAEIKVNDSLLKELYELKEIKY